MPNLYENVSDKDLSYALREAGISKNDTILVHSDLTAFGKLALFDRERFMQTFVDILEASTGTLIMPTFTYSFCNGEVYDVQNSPSTVGALTEYFRTQPGVLRTLHPIFSFALKGDPSFQKVTMDSFGSGSLFDHLRLVKGKLVFLGTSLQACTFIHHVEQMHGIPYRYMKTFPGTIKNGSQTFQTEATFFVRYLDRNVILDLSRFSDHLLEKNLMKKISLGTGSLFVVDADLLYAEGCRLLDQNIYYFLKEVPHE